MECKKFAEIKMYQRKFRKTTLGTTQKKIVQKFN